MTEAPDLERTDLGVERELLEVHLAPSRDCQSLGEGDEAIWSYSDEPVRNGDLVQIRVFPIEKECVGSPDLLQELPVHGQLINHVRLVELEPLVVPVLPAVVSEGSPEAILLT